MRSGITFAGSMIVDHIKKIEHYPERSELIRILSCEESTGGLVTNTGIDFAILDPTVPVFAAGAVGNDPDGDRVIEALSSHGIDTSAILRRGQTSFTDVFAEPNARTFFQYGGACDTFSVEDIDVAALTCRMFHAGYLLLLPALDAKDDVYGTKMARLLHDVKAAGIETSIDVVSESGNRFATIVPPALRFTDYLIFNEIEAEKTTGVTLRDAEGTLLSDAIPTVLDRLFKMGVSRMAIIHAREGAFGMDANGRFEAEASHDLPKGFIRGTVGAGDAFCAGALLAAYRGLSVKEALTYGNAAAQLSLRSASATGSMQTMEYALKEYGEI